jgi:phage baseplate assembly protein gpV
VTKIIYKITVHMNNAPIQTYESDFLHFHDGSVISFNDKKDNSKVYYVHMSNAFVEKVTEVV